MEQMHKRFTAEQVGVLLKGYCQGTTLNRAMIGEVLGIGKTSRMSAKWVYNTPASDVTARSASSPCGEN